MKEKTYAAKQTRTIKVWFSHLGISVSVGVSKERGGDRRGETESDYNHSETIHHDLSYHHSHGSPPNRVSRTRSGHLRTSSLSSF